MEQKTVTFSFDEREQARQAQKHIVDAYPASGMTSSDEEGNPSHLLPVIVRDKLIAMVELTPYPGSNITVTFEDNAPKVEEIVLMAVLRHAARIFRGRESLELQ